MTDEITHFYLATGIRKKHEGGGVSGEDITVHLVPKNDIMSFLNIKTKESLLIDCKIHAALQLSAGKT